MKNTITHIYVHSIYIDINIIYINICIYIYTQMVKYYRITTIMAKCLKVSS